MRLITFISVGDQNREIHILLVMIGVLRLKFQPLLYQVTKTCYVQTIQFSDVVYLLAEFRKKRPVFC